MKDSFKRYILFWFSGSISQLGSSMTSFALILWTYTKTSSAMAVSLMAFCSYLPYILVSLFAGNFVDYHSKKKIILVADALASVCSVTVLLLWKSGQLEIWHIYVVNCLIGIMNSFQSPAQSVAIGILLPKERLAQASGMDSFSNNLISIVSPVLASSLFAFGGLEMVLLCDLVTFIFAFIVLLTYIHIPEQKKQKQKEGNLFTGCMNGFHFLHGHKGLWMIILTMAAMNFFSRLTYENILSPMILARGGNDSVVLGVVNMMLGVGGIIGGMLVSTGKLKWNSIKMIYISGALSFLLGDLMMGFGRNVVWWGIAGIAASFPIPFIMAGQRVILYKKIPQEIQGSVFSARNAIQYSTIPVGILLGGYLADYVFEPFMASNSAIAVFLHRLVGNGTGSGMAVMFLCTGILGFTSCMIGYYNKEIQALKKEEGA